MSVIFEKIQSKDSDILKLFNSSIKCRVLDFLMPAVTYLGSTVFCVFICITTFFAESGALRVLSENLTVSLIVSGLLVNIIKMSVNRIRPYLKISNLNIKLIGIDKYSFPSGHTTAAFSMAVMLSLFYPFMTPIFVFLACCVGMSRMYIGVHYPTDVLVGMCLGTLCSFLVFYI